MNDSICRFMPAKNDDETIKAVRFVYETQFHSLSQPFVHPIYVFHIVAQGTAKLKIAEQSYELKRGDVFFAFPAFPYYIDASNDFEYIYVSFMGSGAATLLSKYKISPTSACYTDFDFLCPMFENAIRRVTPTNANMLTESVLYYALSFFDSSLGDLDDECKGADGIFEAIVNYIDHHYRESSISLGRLAQVFSYTEKYLSSLFKKKMSIGFVNYLNNLRIQYASALIEKGERSLSEIAISCGFSDYSYFARVFKKNTGRTPTDAIKYMKARE